MKHPLYKQYADTKPLAVFGLCNFGGIEVLCLNEQEDYVISCFEFGTGRQNIRKHKIEYSKSGEPFFRVHNKRYYLRDFMKV